MEFNHVSVLLNECIQGLNIKPFGTYADCTMGGCGHSAEICSHMDERGIFIGIDQDESAIIASRDRLSGFKPKIHVVKDNFGNLSGIFSRLAIDGADGFLMDIGVSSHQLDEAERGFSYMADAPLDMRMDRSGELTAAKVVNSYSQDRLAKLIYEYGEERWAKRIAEFIAAERQEKPIETTGGLVSVIKKAVPKGARKDGPHPAKRTFQAIRIEVNGELEMLKRAINDAAALLKPEGRLCIITFHSLEDRIVKSEFRRLQDPCECPPQFPVCVCGKKPQGRIITRKPILPSERELSENHRARSAKLRIFEKK